MLRLRTDAVFRRSALDDADAIITEHELDAPLLIEASRLMALEQWHASPGGRQQHAALFALVASAQRQLG
jgi:hypothetical protein